MIRLIASHRYVVIRGAPLKVMRKLEKVTSYLVAGHRFHPAFRARRWDGRQHLMVFKKGRYTAPIGLLADIKRELKRLGQPFKLLHKKVAPHPLIHFDWNPERPLRPYQEEAVDAFKGMGILKMPIRSGKTRTAARIIRKLQARTLFLVPSQLLLHQTAASLEDCLPGADVGKIGDGEWRQGEITVATVQALVLARGGSARKCKGNRVRDEDSGMVIKGMFEHEACACGKAKCKGNRTYKTTTDPRYTELMRSHDFIVFDECHHLRGEAWHGVFQDSRARYRLGLSATVFLSSKKEVERGVIWLKACCGGIKYSVGTSLLVEQGHLMRQHVQVYVVNQPSNVEDDKWSADLLRDCIADNEFRNRKIVKLAAKALKNGYKNVLISTGRHDQVAALDGLLDSAGLEHGVVVGPTRKATRAETMAAFAAGDFPVLLGTVFGEGVDMPEVEVVINAEGGSDAKKTIQRMRNMTPAKGKTRCLMIDFWDDMNPYFRKHSRARIKTYKAEPAFLVEKMWEKKRLPSRSARS